MKQYISLKASGRVATRSWPALYILVLASFFIVPEVFANPVLTSVNPNPAIEGFATVKAIGSNFFSFSVIQLDGNPIATVLVDGTTLTSDDPKLKTLVAGSSHLVTVKNTDDGSLSDPPITLVVNPPPPGTLEVNPGPGNLAGPSQDLSISFRKYTPDQNLTFSIKDDLNSISCDGTVGDAPPGSGDYFLPACTLSAGAYKNLSVTVSNAGSTIIGPQNFGTYVIGTPTPKFSLPANDGGWKQAGDFGTYTLSIDPTQGTALFYWWSPNNPVNTTSCQGGGWSPISNNTQVSGADIALTSNQGEWYLNLCGSWSSVTTPVGLANHLFQIDNAPPIFDGFTIKGNSISGQNSVYSSANPPTITAHDTQSGIQTIWAKWIQPSEQSSTDCNNVRATGRALSLNVTSLSQGNSVTAKVDFPPPPPDGGGWIIAACAQDVAKNPNSGNTPVFSNPITTDTVPPNACMQVYTEALGAPNSGLLWQQCTDTSQNQNYPPSTNLYTSPIDVRIVVYDAPTGGFPCDAGSSGLDPNFGTNLISANSSGSATITPIGPSPKNCTDGRFGEQTIAYSNVGATDPACSSTTGCNVSFKGSQIKDVAGNNLDFGFNFILIRPNYGPKNITGKATTVDTIQYTWDPASTTPPGGYQILGAPGGPQDGLTLKTAASSPQAVTFSGQAAKGAKANIHTQAQVQGCDNASPPGCAAGTLKSGSGTVVDVYTLAAPPVLAKPVASDIQGNAANLSWTGNGNDPSITPYQVFFTGGGVTENPTKCLTGGTLTTSVTPLKSNTQYTAYVNAYNGLDCGGIAAKSNTVSFCTSPYAPASGLAQDKGATTTKTIGATFPSASNQQLVLFADDGTSLIATVDVSNKTSATIGGNLNPGTQYTMVLRTTSVCGNGTADSSPVKAKTQFSPPQPLTIDNTTASQNSITVTVNPGSGTGFQCINLDYSPSGPKTINSTGGAVPVAGLTANSSYQVGGAQVTDSGCDFTGVPASAKQSSVSGKPAWTKPLATDPPYGVIITPNGSATATISAKFNFAANGSPTTYTLEAATAFGSTCGTGTNLISGTKAVTQTSASGTGVLTVDIPRTGDVYRVRVRAQAASGIKSWDACSQDDQGGGSFLPPTSVTVDPSKLASDQFTLTIKPRAGQAPTFVAVKYSYANDTGTAVAVSPDSGGVVWTAPLSVSGGQASVDIPAPKANSRYPVISISAAVGDSAVGPTASNNGDWSGFTLATGADAWTIPTLPSSDYKTADSGDRTIAVTINFPSGTDPATTKYEVQMVKDPAHFANPDTSGGDPLLRSNPVTTGNNPKPFVNLEAFTFYYIRTYVYGTNTADAPTYDVATPGTRRVKTNSPSASGTIIGQSSGTLTAHWELTSFSNVVQLQAGTSDAAGQSVSSAVSQILKGPFTDGVAPGPITVANLPAANTSYTLVLQSVSSAGGSPAPYSGSEASGFTLAATPNIPTAKITGQVGNFTLNVSFSAVADGNATDSRYAIQITSTSFLDGSGNAVTVPVNQKPPLSLFHTMTEWQTLPGTTTLRNAGIGNTFSISACVLQKSPSSVVCSDPLPKGSPGAGIDVVFPPLNGVRLDKFVFGVGLGGPFVANFSGDMDPTIGSSVTLKDAAGNPVPFTAKYSSGTLSIKPDSPLAPAQLYNLNIPSGLPDLFGYKTTKSFPQSFITTIDPAQMATVASPYDTAQETALKVSPNTLIDGWFPVVRTQLVEPANFLSGAVVGDIAKATNSNKNLVTLKTAEVQFYSPGATTPMAQPAASAAVQLVMSNRGSGARALAAGAAGVDRGTLNIYFVAVVNGAVQKPVLVQGSQSKNGVASAPIKQSGVYILAGAVSTNLNSSYAWPVPFKPSIGHDFIHFVSLASNSSIKIYTIMGELVNTLTDPTNSGEIKWDAKNSDGAKVASGVYIYQVKNDFAEKRGKLIIIR